MDGELDFNRILARDALSPLGGTSSIILDCETQSPPVQPVRAAIIGIDCKGECPPVDAGRFDLLLTSAPHPQKPWVAVDDPAASARAIAANIARNPMAVAVFLRTLRMGDDLSFTAALEVESLAYSTLLGGGEFAKWRQANPSEPDIGPWDDLLRIERSGDDITLILSDPSRRNAISAQMRDQLFDVLANCIDDPTNPQIRISGEGRCFSVGGHLPEFGSNPDLALAHAIRSQRNCALLIAELGSRITAEFHGAVVGSGLEIFAAAGNRHAREGAWFQLPELAMGLMPGAGGTVTVPRLIGRHRTAWMVLSGKRIGTDLAQSWGLIETVYP